MKLRMSRKRSFSEGQRGLRSRSGLDANTGGDAAAFGFAPRVVNAANHGEIGTDCEDQERNGERGGGELTQERTENEENEALRTFPETDAAAVDEGFGAGLRIADHHGSGDDDSGEQCQEEAVDGGIVDEEAEEDGEVGVTVQNGFQESTEEIDVRLAMSKRTSEEVAGSRGNQNNARGEKSAGAEENSGDDAKRETTESKNARGNASARETRDSSLKHPAKGPAEAMEASGHMQARGAARYPRKLS